MSATLVMLVGALIVLAGVCTVTRRNPIHAALSMLIALAGIAVLMLALRSPFLATMQILLYAGAIMVLFVFVIMLLTLRDDELGEEPPQSKKILAAVGALLLISTLLFAISRRDYVELKKPIHQATAEKVEADYQKELAKKKEAGEDVSKYPPKMLSRRQKVDFGSTEHFARFLYTKYAVPFELITVLVMAAVAGVIVLARRPDKVDLERTKLTGGTT